MLSHVARRAASNYMNSGDWDLVAADVRPGRAFADALHMRTCRADAAAHARPSTLLHRAMRAGVLAHTALIECMLTMSLQLARN
jgi:hypothetical protein